MKTATYPIPHDEQGGCLFLFGKPNAPRIVLMCAGFPDDHASFVSLAERLSEKNCFVGVACLPGYDKIGWKDGYSFQEWVSCMREAAKLLRSRSTTPTAKFTGIYHDWGVGAGGLFTSRALKDGPSNLAPDELVLLDVCMPPHPNADLKNLQVNGSILTAIYTFMVTLSYQTVLAKSFLLQRYISTVLAGLQFKLGWTVISWLHLIPCREVDMDYFQMRINALGTSRFTYMAYPYFHLWKAILSGQMTKDAGDFWLPQDLEKTPVLYMYGADKNIHFHDPTTEALFQREEAQGRRSRIVQVPNAGHWLYVQQEDVCVQEIAKFLGL